MTYENILKDQEILKLLNQIDNNSTITIYHGLNHILNVLNNIDKLNLLFNLEKETINNLKITTCLHDLGQIKDKENHELHSQQYAYNYLKNKVDLPTLQQITSAILNHHEKEKVTELSFFEHLLLFADKMDFTKNRINPKYIEVHSKKYLLEKDLLSVNFELKESTFFIIIKTNNLDYTTFKNWSYYPKIYKKLAIKLI